jgi:hypothetical protein
MAEEIIEIPSFHLGMAPESESFDTMTVVSNDNILATMGVSRTVDSNLHRLCSQSETVSHFFFGFKWMDQDAFIRSKLTCSLKPFETFLCLPLRFVQTVLMLVTIVSGAIGGRESPDNLPTVEIEIGSARGRGGGTIVFRLSVMFGLIHQGTLYSWDESWMILGL